MPNRNLDETQRAQIADLLQKVRDELYRLSAGDADLLFAFRRKLAKELTYDERSSPAARKFLKRQMRKLQGGMCVGGCARPLPESYCVLDRFSAAAGYVRENVRLICESCDRVIQKQRGYR